MNAPGQAGTGTQINRDDVDALIDPAMARALDAIEGGQAASLSGMARYQLGLVDLRFQPVTPGTVDTGKRIRPTVVLLATAAAGGDPVQAAPLAAAVELLHNFSLVHDDIQDRSPTRRHRPTVYAAWGDAQAINAGDALFASAYLALNALRERGVPADTILDLADAFSRMAADIVSGQVLDLEYEGRADVTPTDYLRMIRGKTAAILRFSAWGGAVLAGVDRDRADHYAAFGEALGMGFQIRDDLLGIWGTTAETGKAAADDIRRRKQSLPILLLRERANPSDLARIGEIYRASEIDPAGITELLTMMEQYDVRSAVEGWITCEHDAAREHLDLALGNDRGATAQQLVDLVESLNHRTS